MKYRWISACLSVGALLLLTGTTYVIKEGDREVGRYKEPDGRNEIKTVQNEVPPPRASLKAPQPEAPKNESLSRQLEILQGVAAKDQESIRALNRQPWMIKLREWDARYQLKDRLSRRRSLFIKLIFGLMIFWIVFRVVRIFRWCYLLVKRLFPSKVAKTETDNPLPPKNQAS